MIDDFEIEIGLDDAEFEAILLENNAQLAALHEDIDEVEKETDLAKKRIEAVDQQSKDVMRGMAERFRRLAGLMVYVLEASGSAVDMAWGYAIEMVALTIEAVARVMTAESINPLLVGKTILNIALIMQLAVVMSEMKKNREDSRVAQETAKASILRTLLFMS